MVKLKRIYILIIISIVTLVFDYLQLLNFIKSPIDQIIIPIKKPIFASKTYLLNFPKIIASYSQIEKLNQENEQLVKKLVELQFMENKLQEENAKLRIQLEAPFPSSFKFVPAQVLSLTRFLEIEGGTEQGIKKGQIVVDGTTLVGKVVETTPKRSKVMLLVDPDFHIQAVTSRGTRGEIAGQSQETVLLTRILQKDPLFLNDEVITTGEEFVPGNLLIGKISFITQEETASYKQAKIAPLINSANEKIVFVITSL